VKTDRRWLAAGLLPVAVLLLTACGSTSGAPVAGSSTGVKTASTSIGTVLTSSQGRTLYWFAIDTATKSNCSGTCATFWPPVSGPVSAASGVSLPGQFGTITRADGSVQATYDGHPLYTYKGDSGPGQTSGNKQILNGGLWYAMTPSGKPASSAPAASPTSGGGYGYGY
jgi:predicted lipoprotein with Yx(FWY)xxD motif